MNTCPELEVLFADLAQGSGPALDHAQGCEVCSAVLAEHASLEQELFRLSDPLPPSGFVPSVMAKVAIAPVPVRRELWTGLTVLTAAVGALVIGIVSRPGAAAHFGVSVATAARTSMALVDGLGHAVGPVWHFAGLPITTAVFVTLMLSLFGLKKLAGAPALASLKVTP